VRAAAGESAGRLPVVQASSGGVGGGGEEEREEVVSWRCPKHQRTTITTFLRLKSLGKFDIRLNRVFITNHTTLY
jgi:hypothetical protein